jgi:hypothetical protein
VVFGKREGAEAGEETHVRNGVTLRVDSSLVVVGVSVVVGVWWDVALALAVGMGKLAEVADPERVD